MINLSLTDTGQSDISGNREIYLVSFIASDSFDISDMEDYIAGRYQGDSIFREFPVAYLNIIPKGSTYSVGYESYVTDHTEAETAGAIEAYLDGSAFEINSIGIIASRNISIPTVQNGYIFAFGSLSLDTYPLPVNENDSMTYIIPFKINYGDTVSPKIHAPDNLVPWKLFTDHDHKHSDDPTQVHRLFIDIPNRKIRAYNTTLDLPIQGESGGDIDARIRAIQEALEGAVHYDPDEPITSQTEFAVVSQEGNTMSESTVTVESLSQGATSAQLNTMATNVKSIIDSKCYARGYRGETNSSGWTVSGDIKYKDVITNWLDLGLPFHLISVTVIPRNQYFYDYGIKYELQIRDQVPYLRFYTDSSVSISNTIQYHLFVLYTL